MWWDAMRSPTARWNHPKAVEKTVPWKPWKTKPRFPTAPTAPWKTRNLGEFPTFPPPCDSLFPSLKKTKGQEGSMKQADRSSVNKSGQIQKLPTASALCSGSVSDPSSICPAVLQSVSWRAETGDELLDFRRHLGFVKEQNQAIVEKEFASERSEERRVGK